MALSLLRAARPSTLASARGFSSIPISKVARVYRLHVVDEAAAMKVDGIVDSVRGKLKSVKGYDKTARTVCKAEWAYELSIVFDSLDDFKSYDAGEFRQKELLPHLEEVKSLAKGGEIYAGVRVFDEE